MLFTNALETYTKYIINHGHYSTTWNVATALHALDFEMEAGSRARAAYPRLFADGPITQADKAIAAYRMIEAAVLGHTHALIAFALTREGDTHDKHEALVMLRRGACRARALRVSRH